MAKAKKPRLSPLQRAADRAVIVSRLDNVITLTIPISEGFTYPEPECACPGVYIPTDEDEDTPFPDELGHAQGALTRRIRAEIPTGAGLLAWLRAATTRRSGSLPQLAADLLGLPLTPATRQDKAFKAELRKLEEYRQGKYKSAAKERGARILNLALREARLSVSMLADYRISQKSWPCHQAGWQGPGMAPAVDGSGLPSEAYTCVLNQRSILSVVYDVLNPVGGSHTPIIPERVKGYGLAVEL